MYKLGLIGYPVGHSMSPWIHENLMKQQGVEGKYELIEIKPEEFDEKVKMLKTKELDGFNVTVPYKEKIIPYLDGLDQSARHLGAVNTVKLTNDGWMGYNTDGQGFVDSLRNRFPDIFHKGSQTLLLGSGGAARGIYEALMRSEITKIDVANRTTTRAEELIQDISAGISSQPLTLNQAESTLENYGLIVQTTTVGMSPGHDQMIMSLDHLTKGTVVSDIVYRPMKTKFLSEADKREARLHFGHEMLLQQAVYAFKIWTDTEPQAVPLLKEFEQKLKGV
ncbi:shikimate dehydrogenase [Halobacillus karajensis]|uniref:Shikimate dehydrogenase (NADP(+)) n=1 Tax=Halobacillus karajensis TaxID=195088 RepID=A0A024P6A8_9BACI|nr:shikimate dehydrogenase [Halobacillus karajensis]CDQ18069.1 Shikimate dehydrogenase [Halobacillus karajensis]CDQ24420.1 Shikimate dehydrogenase [Halobacillus karajensis]CDQ29332.1 Shikimate dehydrogenase [Halobacillus karajensis]